MTGMTGTTRVTGATWVTGRSGLTRMTRVAGRGGVTVMDRVTRTFSVICFADGKISKVVTD